MSKAIDPDHYTATPVEPIDVIEAWNLGFNLGNAVKYIARAGRKGDRREDLIKAANYAYREATGSWLPKELIADKPHVLRALLKLPYEEPACTSSGSPPASPRKKSASPTSASPGKAS